MLPNFTTGIPLSPLSKGCPGGGIGRRGGFKIRFLRKWGFESPPGYQKKTALSGLFLCSEGGTSSERQRQDRARREPEHTGVRRSDIRSGDGVMRSISPKDFERSSSNPIPSGYHLKKSHFEVFFWPHAPTIDRVRNESELSSKKHTQF